MASKITIKRSLTAAAPAGLSFGEMAFVQGSGNTAEQLYVGISGGNPVWVGARVENTVTDWDSKTRLATQFATVAKINSLITSNTAGVASFNGVTGAVTGVSSFNGLTGAVSGVTTSVANTFTATQTFSAGITVSGYLNAQSINTTGFVSINNTPATLTTTTAGNATVFNSVATSLGIGGAATAITMGAATGTLNLRNPTIQVGNTVATITTASGTGNTLTVSPYGSVVVAPTSTSFSGGSRTSLTVTNTDAGTGTVSVSGGNLYLGYIEGWDGENVILSPANIVFEGVNADAHETTLRVVDPTTDRYIDLPDATGTVALTQTSVASFNGVTGAVTGVSSFNGLTGAVSGVTTSVANTFSVLQTFSAGISSNGGTFGTPTQLVGTNITGTASGLIAGTVTTNANLTGAITSIGNGTTLGSFSSAQLRQALTDETGTGVAVFDTSPNFTTSLTTNSATLALFNSGFPTTLNGFGAATNMTLGATSGNAAIRNPILTLGNSSTSGTITTGNGNLIFVPTGPTVDDGDIASLTITNTESLGQVQIEGGDLFLGNKSDGTTTTPVNIIFEGASANNHEITLTVTDPTADRTITLPDATGTVALTANKLSVFAATTSSELLGVISDETGTGALVFANTPTLVTPNIGAATGTSLVLSGDLTVNGTTTTLNSTTLTIDDKNIELGSVAVPDNISAADGGITLKGATDKTLKWLNSGAFAWTSSENFDLVSTKAYYIAGASVLNATTLGTLVVNSSLTSVGILTSLTVSGTLEAGLIDGGTF